MRILIATETYPPNVNGAALATYRMARGLYKRHNEVFVLAPSPSFKDYKSNEDGITVYRLRSILVQKAQDFRVSPQPLHYREVNAIIKEVNPDIIHINNPGFISQTTMHIAHEKHIPIVGTSHFMPENLVHYLHLPDPIEKLVNSLIWKQYARFYGKLDLIISPTQTAANLLIRSGAKNKILVISNGIDLTKFSPLNEGSYLKKRYGLPEKITCLFVGRLDKEKNIDVFLKAVALIKHKLDFHTVVVGKGAEEEDLKNLAQELGISDCVTFTGYLPEEDLHNIYKVGDVFIMPGIAELQSLVTMEAMACGLPVIGANAVALPHLIHDQRNGFLFEPGNEKDLADKLYIILQNKELREKMSKESLEMIKEHDVDRVMDRTEEAYREVIEEYKRKNNLIPDRRMITQIKRLRNLSLPKLLKESISE